MLMPAITCPPFRPAIIAPTFNNDRTLRELLGELDRLRLPIIVINDGSTDRTGEILAAWLDEPSIAPRRVCQHGQNQGKAAALQRGFAECQAAGFTHAISIDTDGQHAPQDVPAMVALAAEHQRSLILGTRDERCVDYPFRSRWGRRISNLLVRLECGQRVEDSQCGLRVYPLSEIRSIQCHAGRYGFETEIITRARWSQVGVIGTRVTCRYLPVDQRVSHFKPWWDSLLALAMHARLLMQSLSPWRFHPTGGGSRPTIGQIRRSIRQAVRQSVSGINPLSAWRSLRQDAVGRTDFAIGFAIGIFIANLPLYGFQTIAALFTARRLHLNPLSVVAGTQLSIPPIGPVLIASGIVVGHVLVHGTVPTWALLQLQLHGHLAGLLGSMLLDWIVGGVFVGLVLAVLSFITLRLLLNVAFGRQRRIHIESWSGVARQPVAGSAE